MPNESKLTEAEAHEFFPDEYAELVVRPEVDERNWAYREAVSMPGYVEIPELALYVNTLDGKARVRITHGDIINYSTIDEPLS